MKKWSGQARVPFDDASQIVSMLKNEQGFVSVEVVPRMGPTRIQFVVEAPTHSDACILASGAFRLVSLSLATLIRHRWIDEMPVHE